MTDTAPAAATGLPSFDRRALLGSAALATIVAATAALPAAAGEPNPDAELLALRGPHDRARAAVVATYDPLTAAEEAHFDLRQAGGEAGARATADLAAAERDYRAADEKLLAIILAIAAQPARTLDGLILKGEVSAAEDNYVPELLRSIVADLVAMGKLAA